MSTPTDLRADDDHVVVDRADTPLGLTRTDPQIRCAEGGPTLRGDHDEDDDPCSVVPVIPGPDQDSSAAQAGLVGPGNVSTGQSSSGLTARSSRAGGDVTSSPPAIESADPRFVASGVQDPASQGSTPDGTTPGSRPAQARSMPDTGPPMSTPALADPFLALHADVIDDLEKLRIATDNRARQLTKAGPDSDGVHRGFGLDDSHPDVARYLALGDALRTWEADTTRALQRRMRAHPLGPWIKAHKGIGDKQAARLLAVIGDPYWHPVHGRPRTVSELWAYCVPGGELVSTPRGSVPIEQLVVGDEVYGDDGKPRPVERTMSREVDEDLVKVHALKTLPLRVTAEHPVLVARWMRHNHPRRWERTSLTWKRAEQIVVGDYLVIPRLPEAPTGDEPSAAEAGFWGRFVGDGSTSFGTERGYRRGRSAITFGYQDDPDPWQAIASAHYGGTYVADTGTGHQLQFGRTRVADVFRARFGHGATSKRVCREVMESGTGTTRAFLQGYLSADGCIAANSSVVAATVSRGLVLQLQLASTRLGALPSVYFNRAAGTSTIRGRTINQTDRYQATWSPADAAILNGDAPAVARKAKYREDADNFYIPVTAVEREPYRGTVYDLSCGGSFLLNNVVVHNCGYHVVKARRSTAAHHGYVAQSATGGGLGSDPGPAQSEAGVAASRQRGVQQNWSAVAKMRTYLIAESCIKKRDSPYRPVYDAGREKYAEAVHLVACPRCGPSGRPAPEGSALAPGHQHARAMRLVSKAILRDLYRESKRLHEEPR